MTQTRTETDSFGPLEVQADRYWGAQTQRSLMNFPIGWEKQPVAIVRAKTRGARVYAELAGCGMSSDAHHITQPSVEGPERAMRAALADAGLPSGAASLVDSPSRAAGWAMFADQRLALAVARGSRPWATKRLVYDHGAPRRWRCRFCFFLLLHIVHSLYYQENGECNYYKFKNIQADTTMRESIAQPSKGKAKESKEGKDSQE